MDNMDVEALVTRYCIAIPHVYRNFPEHTYPIGMERGSPRVLSLNLMASEEELKAEIARLRAENQALQRPARGQIP